METSTFNILSGLSRPIQNFDPIGSYNQGRQMREEWDQSGRLNELRQKLPSMIEQMKVKNPMLTEKLDSLAEVAKADPMGAYKMLVQLSDDGMNTRNNEEISRFTEIAQKAKEAGNAILDSAKGRPRSELANEKAEYKKAFDSYNSAYSGIIKANGSTGVLTQMGRMEDFNEALDNYEKRKMGLNKAETEYRTAELQEKITRGNLQGQGMQQAKTQAELIKAKNEANVSGVESSKKESERPVQLAKMAGVINKIASIANNIKNAKDENVRKNQANLLLTYASKEAMGALSGEEFQNMIATSGANWQQIVNKFSPFANLKNAPPEIALTNGEQLYNGLKSEYDAILGSLTPQERKYVKVSVSSFPSGSQAKATPQPNTPPKKVDAKTETLRKKYNY